MIRTGDDSYLKDVHLLMLMDDTTILGTLREIIIKKFNILAEFCKKYGMVINEIRTKLMVINGTDEDNREIVIDEIVVKKSITYISEVPLQVMAG